MIQVGIIKAASNIPACKWLHAIPNGGNRDAATGARLKAEGVKRGIPDLFLPVPKNFTRLYYGLYIEVKTKTGRQTKEQRAFQQECELIGYRYEIVRSTQEGIDTILNYLRMK
jgi:hypothetical protein